MAAKPTSQQPLFFFLFFPAQPVEGREEEYHVRLREQQRERHHRLVGYRENVVEYRGIPWDAYRGNVGGIIYPPGISRFAGGIDDSVPQVGTAVPFWGQST